MANDDRPRLTINLGALKRNYRTLKTVAGTAEIMPVVKADAYGLGAQQVVRALMDEGCHSFFVAYAAQAHALHAAGLDATFYCYNARAQQGVYDDRVRPILHRIEDVASWNGGPFGVQIDVGMQRLGIPPNAISELPVLNDAVLAIGHLSDAGKPNSPRNAEQQALFQSLVPSIRTHLPNAKLSLSATGGLFLGPSAYEEVVRPGIGLYGASPGEQSALEPVAKLEARVLAIRTVSAGSKVGYDGKWTAPEDAKIATLSIGYADGVPRSLSGKGTIAVGDKRCPIVGAVSMDLTTVDVTGASVAVGDWAEVFGRMIPLDDMAKDAGTIGYEILTGLVGRTRRVYTDT
ncbi:MAG: alanine racemase [Pseudomonadota bacterium]